MSFKKLFILVIFALHLCTLEAAAESCANYCADFENATTSCADPNITGSGPITLVDVDCMCTVSNTESIARCYECNLLSGTSLELLDVWVIVCYTNLVSGTVAAENCFNQELLKGSIGAPCALATSTTVSSVTPTTVSTSISTSATVTTTPLTTPVASPTSPATVPSSSPTPIAAIVGGSVGGIVAIAILAVLLFIFIRRSKNQNNNPQHPISNSASAQDQPPFYTARYPEAQNLPVRSHQVYDFPQQSNNQSIANNSDNKGSALVPPYSDP